MDFNSMNGFSWIDYTILGIFLVSTLAGLLRGLFKEVVSLLTWIAAFLIAGSFSTKLGATFSATSSQHFSNTPNSLGIDSGQAVSFLSIGISFVLLFVLTLIIGSVINRMITRAVEAGGISFANRFLGALFGLGRGYLINLAIIFIIQLFPMEQNWAGDSTLVASFQPAVTWLDNFVQPGLDKLKSEIQQKTQNVSNSFVQGMNTIYQ